MSTNHKKSNLDRYEVFRRQRGYNYLPVGGAGGGCMFVCGDGNGRVGGGGAANVVFML